MDRIEIGMLAKSKAGHDKDSIYVIINIEETHVYLADGRIRTLANPKKKKIKHIQVIRQKHTIDGIDDVGIKRIIKVFGKEMEGE